MGKFNVNNNAGGVSDLTEQAFASPVADLQEKTPQSSMDSFLEEGVQTPSLSVSTNENAETVAEPATYNEAAQQERERIPTISERFESGTEEFQRKSTKKDTATDDGAANLFARAKNFSDEWEAGTIGINAKLNAGPEKTAALVGTDEELQSSLAPNSPKATLNKIGAVDLLNNKIDPVFAQVGSLVTENFLYNAQTATKGGLDKVDEAELLLDFDEKTDKSDHEMTKSQGNAVLGKEIAREWQRMKNAQEGKPTDEYNDISPEEATVLGDSFKEMYHESNPEILERVTPLVNGGQVSFRITPKGSAILDQSTQARRKMFPTQVTRPTKAITPNKTLVGEGLKIKKRINRSAGKLGDLGVIEEAMDNLHTVANVVDPTRSRIMLATTMHAMQAGPSSPWATVNNVGEDKMASFVARKKAAVRNAKTPEAKQAAEIENDPTNNMRTLLNDLAQSIKAIAQERKGANHLTYQVQPYTGRIQPQQTYFDPTASKTVRFVTRNAVPSPAKKGGRVERNLRQMYAMMILPKNTKADLQLPDVRDDLLTRHTDRLYEWGKEIQIKLDEVMTPAQAEAVAVAIEQGIPLNIDGRRNPEFPQVGVLELSQDLKAHIDSKGEDGLAVLDGILDFKNYVDNIKSKGVHHSYFNAYMDGKTNGIASNGIQMGSEAIAFKTGVLRTNTTQLLDDGIDVRDQLMNELVEDLNTSGFTGLSQSNAVGVYTAAEAVFTNRDLAKATTMTMGYGKDLAAFKKDIDDVLGLLTETNPTVADAIQQATGILEGGRKELVEMIHAKYASGLGNVLSEEAVQTRGIMRSAAIMHALTDKLFTIKAPTGFNLNMGGMQTEIGGETKVQYKTVGGNKVAVLTSSKATSAAEKYGLLGGKAYGLAVVAPVQAMDAATVGLTAAGESWKKLSAKSGGNPYLHTIYDAFKVDAMGYDTVLEESNKNWLDTGMAWSYLEETKAATDIVMDQVRKELSGLPDDTVIPIEDNRVIMIKQLVGSEKTPSGLPKDLLKLLNNSMHKPENASKDWFLQVPVTATKEISKLMIASGFNAYDEKATLTVAQYKLFLNAMGRHLQFNRRVTGMIKHTNEKKGKLKAKIKSQGVKAYQYYSH